MKTIYALIIMLATSMVAFSQTATMTLEFDFQPVVDSGTFVVGTSTPDVAGTFNGWAGTPLTLKSGTVYAVLLTDLTEGDTLKFKGRMNSAWDNTEEFPSGGGDRKVVVVDGATVSFLYGVAGVVGIEEVSKNIQSINQYPNPANNQVNFNYSLTNSSEVSLKLYNVVGAEVMNVTQNQAAGSYNQSLEVSSLENGMYFYTLTSDGQAQSAGKILINR